MTDKITSVLLTGPPGVGKTTIVKKVVKLLENQQIKCSGFYTEEVRSGSGCRLGFDVVNLDGKRAILARELPTDNVRRPKVGKYHVHVKDFEEIALPALKVPTKTLLIIDEIGKMELLSRQFKQQIVSIFGKTPILATVPNRQTIDVVERMKSDKHTVLIEINKQNRNEIVDHVFEKSTQLIGTSTISLAPTIDNGIL